MLNDLKIPKHLIYFIPLFILLALDLMLMVFDVINFYNPFPNTELYDIETNNSYAEDFQNFKWIIMIIALSLIAMFRREKRYLAWILVFLFLFLEDVFRIHRALGHFLYDALGMTTGQRGGKIMELFAAAFLGFIFVAPVLQAYKTGDTIFRKHSKAMLLLLILFLFCAIVVNPLHKLALIQYNWKFNIVFGMLKDGGELITESFLTGYLVSIALKQKADNL